MTKHTIRYSRAAVVHLNIRAGSIFPVQVWTVPSSMDRTSRCNKVDTVRLYALNLLLLKGQRCVNYSIFKLENKVKCFMSSLHQILQLNWIYKKNYFLYFYSVNLICRCHFSLSIFQEACREYFQFWCGVGFPKNV